MPRGRPKGSKNKSSSSRSKGTATATQLASLAKARKVRAKQIKYFPALPPSSVIIPEHPFIVPETDIDVSEPVTQDKSAKKP